MTRDAYLITRFQSSDPKIRVSRASLYLSLEHGCGYSPVEVTLHFGKKSVLVGPIDSLHFVQ